MVPLSRELSGLIIPHDNFGSPLDDQGKTIDSVFKKITSNMQVHFFTFTLLERKITLCTKF